MKVCTRCGAQLADSATFCPHCGMQCGAQPPADPRQAQNGYPYPAMPYDHTAEYDPRDIAANKVLCMPVYLMGILGLFIALLAGTDSPYAKFHVKEGIKLAVLESLLALCASILAITLIVPLLALIMLGVLVVVRVICFVKVCGGKAEEAPIVRGLGFLR